MYMLCDSGAFSGKEWVTVKMEKIKNNQRIYNIARNQNFHYVIFLYIHKHVYS